MTKRATAIDLMRHRIFSNDKLPTEPLGHAKELMVTETVTLTHPNQDTLWQRSSAVCEYQYQRYEPCIANPQVYKQALARQKMKGAVRSVQAVIRAGTLQRSDTGGHMIPRSASRTKVAVCVCARACTRWTNTVTNTLPHSREPAVSPYHTHTHTHTHTH